MNSPIASYYTLSSDRLTFRPFTKNDIDLFIPFFDQDDYQEFLALDCATPARERSTSWISRQMERMENRKYGQVAIVETSSGKFIGVGGIIQREVNGLEEYEITYSLLPAFWGNGYARELALRCIDFAQEHLSIDSVISLIHPENKASINVAEANGLVLDGASNFLHIPVLIYRRIF